MFADTERTPSVSKKPLAPLPDWCEVGESIQIRPYNYSGVVAYIGHTEFAPGTWIGVDLDVPMGKAFHVMCILMDKAFHIMFKVFFFL